MRLGLLLLAFALVAAIGLGIGVARDVASRARADSVPAADALAAEQEARVFWDNPLQRIVYVAFGTTDVRNTAPCPIYIVIAYTLYGIPLDKVFVNCEGVHR